MKYFNINGIPTDSLISSSVACELDKHFFITSNDNTDDIDIKLYSLEQKVAIKLFGSLQNMSNLPFDFKYSRGGIGSDIKISKQGFEKLINFKRSSETHKQLYYYDFLNLVGSLRNLIQESRFLFYDFYKTLNENTFMLVEKPIKANTTMFTSGRAVTNIFSKINHLFINLTSQLDFITKISLELEKLPQDFTQYPKFKSKNILYGDFKRIKMITFENTVFEKTDDLKLIIGLRDEIIHNASFESIPKVYQVFKNSKMIEKFILIPDTTNGILDSFKNRNRFFHKKVKLNERLPSLITGFWKKMEVTIDKLK